MHTALSIVVMVLIPIAMPEHLKILNVYNILPQWYSVYFLNGSTV